MCERGEVKERRRRKDEGEHLFECGRVVLDRHKFVKGFTHFTNKFFCIFTLLCLIY